MLGTALALVATCGAINVAVDPLGIFGAPRLPGINAVKPYLDHHRELSRWSAARQVCAKAAIFGNSRAEIGFDPEHRSFAALNLDAFNHAIPGTSVGTSLRQLHWLKAAGCAPHAVVVGVEFFDFLGGSQNTSEGAIEAAPGLDGKAWAEAAFSLTALRDSIITVRLQQARFPATITQRGFNPLLHYELEVQQSGHNTLFRQRGGENLKNWSRKPQRLLSADGSPSADQWALDAFLQEATPAASTVHLVIYPYHVEIRLMIERAGLGGLFAEWKAWLVKTAKQRSNGATHVEVWDFSGVSPQTTEPIPEPGDRKTRMLRYWEAGHFKRTLGDQVLNQLLGDGQGFGRRLDTEMLASWLVQDRQQVELLRQQPSALTAEVDRLFIANRKPVVP